MTLTAQPKVWFITGTSSGLGRALTEYVLSKGHIVVATLRKPKDLADLKTKFSAEQLLLLKLDVSQSHEITAAFDKVKEVFGRLDVVVNNAGYAVVGEIESTPEDLARKMYDVNFWGPTNISKAAVKFFRDVNKPGIGGRLINVSSMAGIYPFGMTGFYSSSKHALASELDPDWNIKISLIEPGGYRTDSESRSAVQLPLDPVYNKSGLPSTVFCEYLSKGDHMGGDPNKAVAKYFELSELPEPPLRLVLGQDAIAVVRGQIDRIVKDVDAREDWSKNLGFD